MAFGSLDAAKIPNHIMPSRPRLPLFLCLLFLLTGGLPVTPTSQAQSADDPLRFAFWLVEDVRAVPDALSPPTWIPIGAAAAGVIGLSAADASLAADLQEWHRRELWRVVEEFGDANAMRPAAVIVFVGSLLQDDRRVQDAAFTGLESLVLSNVLTNLLKAVHGRSRPWQERGANNWKPFSGRTSFPSGHATTAFALMTPWVVYFGHPVAWLGMGVATATSLSRVTLRYHWPSDVLAGALIGSGVSWWLSKRHQRASNDNFTSQELNQGVQVSPFAHPFGAGVRVSF